MEEGKAEAGGQGNNMGDFTRPGWRAVDGI
jgi:hypothetical protein